MNSFLEQFGDDETTSVTDYTRRIKRLLEGSIEPEWIRGEISNFRKQASGHLYFSLKDERAQLPVVMFRSNASGLDFEIRDGMELLVYGELSVYEPHVCADAEWRSLFTSSRAWLHSLRNVSKETRALHRALGSTATGNGKVYLCE